MNKYTIRFPSRELAEKALRDAGFSLGINQRDDPRGILFGDIAIAKWRNMSTAEKDRLDGVYQRAYLGGPVEITMRTGGAPGDALRKLEAAAETAAQST